MPQTFFVRLVRSVSTLDDSRTGAFLQTVPCESSLLRVKDKSNKIDNKLANPKTIV